MAGVIKCVFCSRQIVTFGDEDDIVQCLECHDMRLTEVEMEDLGPEINAMSYPDYLRSDHWASIRQTKIDSVGGVCAFCSSTLQLHVHHREYPTDRMKVTPGMLVVLCKRCHGLLHGVE
jgi:hypothetical protein